MASRKASPEATSVNGASTVAVSLALPVKPPERAAVTVTDAGAFEATPAVRAMGGHAPPIARESEREQETVASVQVQPDPAIAVVVRPEGKLPVMVTAPLDAALPEFETVMVNDAADCPWVKLPVWVSVTEPGAPLPVVVVRLNRLPALS